VSGPARPTVVRLVTRMNIGGPARHALLLTKALAGEYHTVLAAGRPTASEGELTDPEVTVHPVPLVRPLDVRADARSLTAVRRLLAKHRPALLHTHMAKAGTVGRLAALGASHRPRTVHTFHGHVLEGYFGPAARRAFLETERLLARGTDALVAVSPEIRDELLALGIGTPRRFHVIPLGLDLGDFLAVERPAGALRPALGLPPGAPLAGIVGRLVPIKDHVTALRALAKVPGAHLAVIGDGELRPDLEAHARELGVADRAHFVGWRADMAAALSDLDVVLLTSRNEGTPVALIEASAAGRPVVATDVGGVRSVVADGTTGLLAPPGDADAVAALLARLLAGAGERRRMGAAGREHVRRRFGADRLVRDVADLYRDLLASPPRRRGGRLRVVEPPLAGTPGGPATVAPVLGQDRPGGTGHRGRPPAAP
jgi:glycosyltransferase involved in cell wall biosynthesis